MCIDNNTIVFLEGFKRIVKGWEQPRAHAKKTFPLMSALGTLVSKPLRSDIKAWLA